MLLVGDEEDIIRWLYAIFEGLGNHVAYHAKDGKEALDISRVNNPNTILLDV
jgi:CheY-like chemotaxis protein